LIDHWPERRRGGGVTANAEANWVDPLLPVPVSVERGVDQRRLTAYHEAGHAVAHVLFRLPFIEVHIVPDETTGGALIPAHRYSWPSRRWAKRKIITLLAGPEAQIRARGYQGDGGWLFDVGAESDVAKALNYAALLHLRGAECTCRRRALAYVRILHRRAVRLWEVPEYWRAVQAVAQSLLEQPYGWLPSVDVRRIVRTELAAA
jgi:hypothetical protein